MIEVIVLKYKRPEVDWALMGICRDTSNWSYSICFVNDKGRLARRHGGLMPSPSTSFSSRAHFHCCGPQMQAETGSFLDFSPTVPVCYGRDHKNRNVTLELYQALQFLNDADLERYFKHEWPFVSNKKRKHLFIECD